MKEKKNNLTIFLYKNYLKQQIESSEKVQFSFDISSDVEPYVKLATIRA